MQGAVVLAAEHEHSHECSETGDGRSNSETDIQFVDSSWDSRLFLEIGRGRNCSTSTSRSTAWKWRSCVGRNRRGSARRSRSGWSGYFDRWGGSRFRRQSDPDSFLLRLDFNCVQRPVYNRSFYPWFNLDRIW